MAQGDLTFDLLQHASVAGELAPNLWGRTDFEKYDSAWAELRNWFVDYRGGISTRAGFPFCDVIKWTAGNRVRLFRFQFSPDTTDTYLLVFSESVVRFVQDGAYVLETAVAVGSVANGAGDRITITATSHGFSDGDWVKPNAFTGATLLFLNGRTCIVANKTTHTFDIKDVITGALITKAAIVTDTGTVSRVYTVATPYAASQFAELKIKQVSDYVRLTHPDFPIKNLIRSAATSWAISDEVIGRTIGTVTGAAFSASSPVADHNYCYYFVAAVGEDGEEGLPDIIEVGPIDDIMSKTQEFATISWTAVTNAVYYKVYRTRLVSDAQYAYSDMEAGYVGRSTGTTFSDPGITPDYTDQPKQGNNPFANGRIRYVNVTAAGTGADYDSVITWPAGGSGAYGFLITEGDGSSPILGVRVLYGGVGYTGTAVSVADASTETLVAVLSPASGNYPHCFEIFQQRGVYGATDNEPLRLFGSRTGLFSNFDTSPISADDDAYELDIDTDTYAPIRHLVAIRGGLIAFSQAGVWLNYSRNTEAFSPNTAKSDLQNRIGASQIQPVLGEQSVFYVSQDGQELRMLTYDDYNKVLSAQNISLLSNHLFSPLNEVIGLTYANRPFKMIYSVQENGCLLSCTVDSANSVYACSQNWTQGFFRDVCALDEHNTAAVYVAVERYIQSTRCLFLERQAQRDFSQLEEAICLDASLTLPKTAPAGRLTPSTPSGAVTFTVTGATPFGSGDVGKILRCGSGKATIDTYTSSTVISGTWTRDLDSDKDVVPETTIPKGFDSGDWWLDSPVTTVRGLWHLIGQTVNLLADGVAVNGIEVDAYGQVVLPEASRVTAGLPFVARAKSLPPTVTDINIESRKKDIVSIDFRVLDSYGLKCGTILEKLYDVADREARLWGRATRLRNERLVEFLRAAWDKDSPVYFVQSDPYPATILNYNRELSLGDERQ